MSFIIEINGKDITTIEDIRDNFDIDVLLSHKGDFDVWLAGWDYEDEAAQVRELSPDLSDDDWLKKVCKIIGIPSATLTAARKRAKAEAEAKPTVYEKKKAQKKKKELSVNNLRITVTPKFPQKKPTLVCDAGIISTNANGDWLFSKDAESFIEIDPGTSCYADCYYLNDCFILIESSVCSDDMDSAIGISFSKDGVNWHQIPRRKFLEYIVQEGGFESPYIDSVLFDGKQYMFLCNQTRQVAEGILGGWISRDKQEKAYYIIKAESLEGPYIRQELGDLENLSVTDLYFGKGKYFLGIYHREEDDLEIRRMTSDYGYSTYDNGVYYSDDAESWIKADSSDKWLDGLVINRFAYANFDDDSGRFYIFNPYAFRSVPLLYKNKIAFKFSGSDILAAPVIDLSKEEFGEFKTVTTYGFELEYAYLFRDKILLYGENDSFAIGEISTIS